MSVDLIDKKCKQIVYGRTFIFSGHSPNSDYSPYNHDIRRLFSDGLNLERLRGSRILVVGATGLIGSCIVDVLMQNPDKCYQVIASGRNRNRANRSLLPIGRMIVSPSLKWM